MTESKYVTIDNIPKSAYDQYAKNSQYQSGPVQIQSASKLSKDAAIPAAAVARAPEAEDKFNIGRNQVLALFPEPPVSPEKMKFFFTHELTPSFGTSAQIQELIDQVAVKAEGLKEPADMQAFKTINTALETALKLGRTLEWINNKRLEFSKG